MGASQLLRRAAAGFSLSALPAAFAEDNKAMQVLVFSGNLGLPSTGLNSI
jgi:hypothetical protein